MRNPLSDKIVTIPPSGIRKFFDIVSEMKDAISLGVGEPDFDTPWHIREEGIYSLEKGRTFYTSNAGLLELRKAIAHYMYRKYELTYNPAHEIVVTVGGSEGIDLALRAMLNPGDEVILPEPAFVSYLPCVKLADGVPVTIDLKEENHFKLKPEELLAAITDKTKILILSYPNNPTGAIMTREDLEPIAEIVKEKDLYVISDEIYAELTYDDSFYSLANFDEIKDQVIIISGFSKAYAMTGWRLGYVLGNKTFIKAMNKIHQYIIMSASTPAQYGAIDAMRNGDIHVQEMRESYLARRNYITKGFNRLGLTTHLPQGAFYIFPDIRSTGLTSDEFCEKLLQEQHVACVPGTAFGEAGEGFIRVSYAYSIEHIKEALDRIEKFLDKLHANK